jgi:hypothetical protein
MENLQQEESAFDELVIEDIENIKIDDFNESSEEFNEESGPRRLSVEDLEENSKMSATMAVGILEAAILMWKPQLQYDDDTRREAVEKLAPVFAKHGGELPPWLAAWQEELKAVVFFGGVAFSSYLQIKAANDVEILNDDKEGESVG